MLLFWLGDAPPVAAQSENVPAPDAGSSGAVGDIPSLTQELHRLSGDLEKPASPVESAVMRDSLPKQWTVRTSERDYAISSDTLRGQLSAGSQEKAKAWVDHLANELDSYSANAPRHPANARAELDRILAEPQFASVHAPTAWDLLRQRITHWLARLFERLFEFLDEYPIGGRILFWVIVVACVGFIAMWVFRFLVGRERMESLPPCQRVVASRTWQEWIRAAREAANRRDFREAVHCAYWAGITRLEDSGVLPKDPTRTPRESLRLVTEPSTHELAAPRTYREPLSSLTKGMEQTWYANRGARPEDFDNALRQLEALGCPLE